MQEKNTRGSKPNQSSQLTKTLQTILTIDIEVYNTQDYMYIIFSYIDNETYL